jgi:hypothetical protein
MWPGRHGPDLQMVQQGGGGGRHGVHGGPEGFGVVPGRSAETADLPDVLQGGGADVLVSDLLGVGRAEGLDAAAHNPTVRHVLSCAEPPGPPGLTAGQYT